MTLRWTEDGLYRSPKHEYWWIEDGVPHIPDGAPSVTTILKQVDKSGAFSSAAARKVAEAAIADHDFIGDMMDRDRDGAVEWLRKQWWKKTEKAMATGTDVHQWAEDYAKGQLRLEEPDEHIKPYLYQFGTGFLEKYAPRFEHIEEMVYSLKAGYGGTFDLIATIDGERWLIDYKTSDKPIAERGFPYPDTSLQLAALGYADFIGRPEDDMKHPIPPIDHYGVVAITPTECRLVPYDVTEAEYQTFLHYRNVHEWMQTRKDKVKR
jgi:hypothetical protein